MFVAARRKTVDVRNVLNVRRVQEHGCEKGKEKRGKGKRKREKGKEKVRFIYCPLD